MSKRGQTLLRGHTLRSEGAAYSEDGKRVELGGRFYYGTSGEGRALCSCGAMSPVLPSAYQRRQWHREHKESLR